MKSIVITPKNRSEFEFLSNLFRKLGLSTKTLTEEEQEDIGLSLLMREVDRSDKVKESTILKKLQ
jgi:hypothetical protein